MSRDVLTKAVLDVRTRFFHDPFHVHPEAELADLLDTAVIASIDPVVKASTKRFSLFAAGGYGRRTLHPASDLDFLILFRDTCDDRVVRTVLDSLGDPGFEVGYQAKKLTDLEAFDSGEVDGYTAFFEARYLAGDNVLASEFMDKHLPTFVSKNRTQFLRAIAEVRAARHSLDTHGLKAAEPNVKTGIGGLRDYHFVRWISWVLGIDPPQQVEPAVILVHQVRNFLHYLSQRDENVLKRVYQDEIARRLGYGKAGAMGLMRAYSESTAIVLRCSEEAAGMALRREAGS